MYFSPIFFYKLHTTKWLSFTHFCTKWKRVINGKKPRQHVIHLKQLYHISSIHRQVKQQQPQQQKKKKVVKQINSPAEATCWGSLLESRNWRDTLRLFGASFWAAISIAVCSSFPMREFTSMMTPIFISLFL